jgi:hypothetical protein
MTVSLTPHPLCRARALVLKWKAVVAKEEREREEQESGEQQEEEEEDDINHHQEEEEEGGQDGVAQGKPRIGSIYLPIRGMLSSSPLKPNPTANLFLKKKIHFRVLARVSFRILIGVFSSRRTSKSYCLRPT